MKTTDTERKVEINGVPDFKAIPKAVLEPVIETLLANMLAYYKENKEEQGIFRGKQIFYYTKVYMTTIVTIIKIFYRKIFPKVLSCD